MIRPAKRLILVAVLAVLGIWAWRIVFPNPERVITTHLQELALAASIPPNEPPVTRLANVVKMTSLFAPDAEVSVDVPGRYLTTLQGRDKLREAAMAARSTITTLTIDFVDIGVTINPDRVSAVANLTAKATVQGEMVPQEFKFEFRKVGRDWLIERASTVKTLR